MTLCVAHDILVLPAVHGAYGLSWFDEVWDSVEVALS